MKIRHIPNAKVELYTHEQVFNLHPVDVELIEDTGQVTIKQPEGKEIITHISKCVIDT